jgi:hypothetical protein
MYDTWIFDYDFKYGHHITSGSSTSTNVVEEKGYRGTLFFVFNNKKIVYYNYIHLAYTDVLAT